MAEALVIAHAEYPTDGGTGALWTWARGHIVDRRPDGYMWHANEDPRNFPTAAQRRFALLRFPGVSIARLERYMVAELGSIDPFTGQPAINRQRLWQISWDTLPPVARNIIRTTGMLTIGGPNGDFTWAQVQAFFIRLDTNASDGDPLT